MTVRLELGESVIVGSHNLGLLSLAVILLPGNFMIIRCLVSRFAALHIETATFIILKLATRVLLKQNTSGHKMPLGIDLFIARWL